jgi:adenine-specific DNA-methyltransferase
VSYHKGDKHYNFLNLEKVKNFDDLDSLFFRILAKKVKERDAELGKIFTNVPYLNSSLFEPTDIEHQTIFLSNLQDNQNLPLLGSSKLKNSARFKNEKELSTLEYLFEFLNAYDFSGEGSEDIQEDNKTLINASVLGLIFEKINGYKDGSFFTPGFITMYMCKETISRAVVQKFNEKKGWELKEFDELYDKIETKDRKEANEIIDSLKICDPAVGSGHFLVSALNEIIAIKADLKILCDREGKRLKEYQVEVVNDELIITDEEDQIFEYNPKNKENQRVQETLFHEKQTIIENCLFGVDINPNSVKICRLRLWIELLKSAYYKADSNFTELETLPNIDINIKCGNSLISRFALDSDLKDALKKSKSKWSIDSYKMAVHQYQQAESKEQKREMERLINEIKSNFRSEIGDKDPKKISLNKVKNELINLNTQTAIFGMSEKEKKKFNNDVERKSSEITKLETEIEEIKSNKIYENAFEWRFEFPEVLNNDGDFVGFDMVIGNPPYVQLQSIKEISIQLERFDYKTFSSMGDLYALFYEKGNQILNQGGTLCFISGSAWMRTNYGQALRTFFNTQTSLLEIIDLSDCDIFDSATVLTTIVTFKKSNNKQPIKAIRFTKKDQDKLFELKKEFDEGYTEIVSFPETSWIIGEQKAYIIRSKVEAKGKKLKDWDIKINRGILTGYNDAFIIDRHTKESLIAKDPKSAEVLKPILRGRDVQKYYYENSELWLIGTFPSRNYNIDDFPAIKDYLLTFGKRIEQSGEKGSRKKTSGRWFETQDSIAYWEDFAKPKIIYPNMTKFLPFSLDLNGNYLNDKCFILSGEKLYFLTAFLNSKLFKFCFSDAFPELQGNSKEIKKFILEEIPVVAIKDETPFYKKVEKILALKKQNHLVDTTELENEIDQLVYKLYELTPEEIQLIENNT